jgi:FKBP-type peptidyl-prolyl cis-trans isomerase 2
MKVEWGSLVSLDYDMLLDSGEQIDSSAVNGPLHIRVGERRALPGLGEKLVGLDVGDERLVRLAPAEAFGDWDPDAILTMRESWLMGDVDVQDGMMLRIETSTGFTAVCRAFRIAEDRVALDFNHPLAGEALTFFVRVVGVSQPA